MPVWSKPKDPWVKLNCFKLVSLLFEFSTMKLHEGKIRNVVFSKPKGFIIIFFWNLLTAPEQ